MTLRRQWHPTPVLLPGKSHGPRRLGRTRLSDFTFTFHFPALEKEMATHSSVLAWRIPGTGEPGGLPSLGSHRVGHDWSDLAAAAAAAAAAVTQKVKTLPAMRETWVRSLSWDDPLEGSWQPTLVVLPGDSMDRWSWQMRFMSSQNIGHDWATNAICIHYFNV